MFALYIISTIVYYILMAIALTTTLKNEEHIPKSLYLFGIVPLLNTLVSFIIIATTIYIFAKSEY